MTLTRFCCCCSNLTGAKLVAILVFLSWIGDIVGTVLTFVFGWHKGNQTTTRPILLAISTVGCVCLLAGLICRRPTLLKIYVVWQTLGLVAITTLLVLTAALGAYVHEHQPPELKEDYPSGVVAVMMILGIFVALGILVKVWAILIVNGARKEMEEEMASTNTEAAALIRETPSVSYV